jgi:nitrous oxide reductase accessory protein NosL
MNKQTPKTVIQPFLFVAMPSDYGHILFPVADYHQAREFIKDAGGVIIRFDQIMN